MSGEIISAPLQRAPELLGQTVVCIGVVRASDWRPPGVPGPREPRSSLSAGSRAERAAPKSTRNAPKPSTPPIRRPCRLLPGPAGPIDHVLVTAGGPRYVSAARDGRRRGTRGAQRSRGAGARGRAQRRGQVRPGGSLVFMGGTGGRRIDHRLGIVSAATAALPPFTAALALELAPVRVNLIAAGFVDTPLSASLLGDQSRTAAPSCARHCRSAASSSPKMSPRSPST